MNDHYIINNLPSGKAVWVSRQGDILAEIDEHGRVNEGCLTHTDKAEANLRFAELQAGVARQTAEANTRHPRYDVTVDEIFRRYSPAQVELIDGNAPVFNQVFDEISAEVGPSESELEAEGTRKEHIKEAIERTEVVNERDGSLPIDDIATLLRGGR